MEEGELFQNKYRIGKLLGEGAMGVVYAAVQEPSGLPVAIKFVRARNINGERLVREAKVLARLNHGNLVRLYDLDETADGDYFIVMELVEGDSLRALLNRARKEGRALEPQVALHIMLQVTEGVGAAHRAGIVHRDLKPDNIMVLEGADPVVRVVDFGLAKNPAGGPIALPAGVETNPAVVVGTPRYMAPEQVRGGEIDARTDLFAIGVTLYEALTGRFPFERPDDDVLGVTEVFARQCHAEPTPLGEHLPGCSPRVSKIVLRCLAKDPADRYQTARELARDIRAALAAALSDEQQAEQKPAAADDARETAPMPAQWTPGAVLPFESSNHAPAPAAHVVRETAPMPPPGSGGLPQPTYAAVQPSYAAAQPITGRGVGYTTKMARPSAAALATAQEEEARTRAAQSPAPRADSRPRTDPPPSGPIARDSDAHGGSDRPHRQGPASTSGVHLKQPTGAQDVPSRSTEVATAPASFDRASEPHAMSHQQSLSGASMPQHAPAPRSGFLGVPPVFAAPIVGSAIAAIVLVAWVLLRAPSAQHATKATTTTAASVPAPPPTATVQDTPTGTASSAAPPSAAPADTPIAAQDPTTTGTGTAAAPTASAAPTATPRAPTPRPKPVPPPRHAPKPFARTNGEQQKPPPPPPKRESEPPVPTSGPLFGVER